MKHVILVEDSRVILKLVDSEYTFECIHQEIRMLLGLSHHHHEYPIYLNLLLLAMVE